MNRLNRVVLTCITLSMALLADAIPARKGNIRVMQPDGTQLTIHAVGDENTHYTLTDDNKLLITDNDGRYCYAYLDNDGQIKSTGIAAADSAVRPQSHASYLTDISSVAAAESAGRSARARSVSQKNYGKLSTNFPTIGEVRALIILAEYSDCTFKNFYTDSAKQYFTDMLTKHGFSEYAATGSAVDYFEDASSNQFHPKFDVVGPVALPHAMSYYGANNASGNDVRPAEMIVDACQLADSMVNFADYDNDGDGYCDNVYVVYAGNSEASSYQAEAIWPHAWYISEAVGSPLVLDGIKIDRYACSSELLTTHMPDGIGTFVHEFSHVMGLPDLYSTSDSEASYTPGAYSVMDSGSYNNDSRTPPTYSSFERNAMGWIDLQVLNIPGDVELENLEETNQAYVVETATKKEFFLFENRQHVGWDAYLPNHGMLIWHIDYSEKLWREGRVNDYSFHPCVDIVKANNDSNGSTQYVVSGWTWPGTQNVTQFTPASSPAFIDWSGNDINVPICNIAEDKTGVVSFEVMFGSVFTSSESRITDGTSTEVSTAGLNLLVRTTAAEVSVYNILGHKIATVHVADGVASAELPSAGVYIVRSGCDTTKIVVN